MTPAATHEPLSQTVVEAVADAENVDPTDLEPPIYDVIDPDALDALFESTGGRARSDVQVVFEYCGHTVVAATDGTVVLADEPTVLEEAL